MYLFDHSATFSRCRQAPSAAGRLPPAACALKSSVSRRARDDLSCLSASPPAGLKFIDHIVGNQPDDQMVPVSDW